MLGHQLLYHLRQNHDVKVTLRQDTAIYGRFEIFTAENSYPDVEAQSIDKLFEVIAEFQPDAVVNAIGIIKQRNTAKDSIPSDRDQFFISASVGTYLQNRQRQIDSPQHRLRFLW